MKKMFFLSTLISFAMICSCQKQDSAAEAQLAQRNTELDAREEALIQREKAVAEREKAVAEREKAVASSRVIQSPAQVTDPAQAEPEKQKAIQQVSEFQGLIQRAQADKAEEMRRLQERSAH